MLAELLNLMMYQALQGISRAQRLPCLALVDLCECDFGSDRLHLDFDLHDLNIALGFIVDAEATGERFAKLD